MLEEKEIKVIEVESSMIDSNCYTITEFSRYLTENYKKKSKAPFTPHEAREFAMSGRLPDKYGGIKLEYVSVIGTGVKFVRIVKEENELSK